MRKNKIKVWHEADSKHCIKIIKMYTARATLTTRNTRVNMKHVFKKKFSSFFVAFS